MSNVLDTLDGSFIPPGVLPSLGSLYRPAGWRSHLRDVARGGWHITVRKIEQPVDVRSAAWAKRREEAAELFQETRLTGCESGHVVEILQPVLGGWVVRDRAPWMRQENLTAEHPRKELVRAYDGEILGVVWPDLAASWALMVAVPGQPNTYASPEKFRAAVFPTRLEAIASCTKEDRRSHDWAKEWSDQMRGLVRAGIGTRVEVSFRLLGPTGGLCSIPGCDREAIALVTRQGHDVGVESRMSCALHAGEAVARQFSPEG